MAEITPVRQTPPLNKVRPVSPDEGKERRKQAPPAKAPPRQGEDDEPPTAIDEYA
jgi:hypothetical protein